MVDVKNETEVTLADVAKWFELADQLRQLKAAESMLRSRIVKHFYPNLKEGVNTYDLNDGTGYVMKASHETNRKVLEPELKAMQEAMATEGSNLLPLNFTELLRWKPEVNMKAYRALNPEAQKQFEQILEIKPGSTSIEIVKPKR